MAVIALFLAVYYGMLEGTLSPTGVGWSCAMIGLVAYALWRIGWETKGKDEHPSGREWSTILRAASTDGLQHFSQLTLRSGHCCCRRSCSLSSHRCSER